MQWIWRYRFSTGIDCKTGPTINIMSDIYHFCFSPLDFLSATVTIPFYSTSFWLVLILGSIPLAIYILIGNESTSDSTTKVWTDTNFLPFPVLIDTDSTLDPIFDVLQALFLPAPFLTTMVGKLQIRGPIPLPTLQSKLEWCQNLPLTFWLEAVEHLIPSSTFFTGRDCRSGPTNDV